MKNIKVKTFAKADQDAITLRSMTIILNQFKEQITAEQVGINQYFSEDINRLTAVDDSPDNSLVTNKDKGLFVKQTIKATEKEIDAGNKVITHFRDPRSKNDAVNLEMLTTNLLKYDKKLLDQQTLSKSIETKIGDLRKSIDKKTGDLSKSTDKKLLDLIKSIETTIDDQETHIKSIETKIGGQETHTNNIERAVVNILRRLLEPNPIDKDFVLTTEGIMSSKQKK